MKKKVLWIFTLIAIMTVLFAISISAAEPIEVIDISKNNDGSVIASFYDSGEYFTVNVNGASEKRCFYTLTVTGNGKMRDFDYWESVWSPIIERTKTATIESGVTNIGANMFYLSGLKEITIADSVTHIGAWAFDYTGIKTIQLPNSVVSIGREAFCYCDALEKIIIPESVEEMEHGVFVGCPSLTVFCKAPSEPSKWSNSWNYERVPVYWGCLSEESYLNKIFTFKGYSFDWTGSMAIGFDIDYESVAFYKKMTGLPFEMGVVFTGYETLMGKQPLDEKATPVELVGGKVLKANLCGLDYLHYDFMLTDIIESARDVELVIAAYLYDGNGIKYVQGNGLSDTVSGISYNRAKESGTK